MAQAAPYTLLASFSVECFFLGMNCVLYGFCLYTLWGQQSISGRLLLLINTVQFLLCATQTTLDTVLYFIMFAILSGNIQPYLHHVNGYILTSTIIFNINFITVGFLSIWRLYVLYDHGIWVCIAVFVVWIAQICAGGMTIRICATTPVASTTFKPVNMLLWALITALNLCVAILIFIRLCIAQKRTHAVLGNSVVISVAIVLVDCGALITACSMAMTVLYASNYTYALASIGVATEVAVASQLLVTARHGMSSQGHPTSGQTSTAPEVSVMQTESRPADPPVKMGPLCSFAEPESHDKQSRQPLDAA